MAYSPRKRKLICNLRIAVEIPNEAITEKSEVLRIMFHRRFERVIFGELAVFISVTCRFSRNK